MNLKQLADEIETSGNVASEVAHNLRELHNTYILIPIVMGDVETLQDKLREDWGITKSPT